LFLTAPSLSLLHGCSYVSLAHARSSSGTRLRSLINLAPDDERACAKLHTDLRRTRCCHSQREDRVGLHAVEVVVIPFGHAPQATVNLGPDKQVATVAA
jgi:hypothetical protein